MVSAADDVGFLIRDCFIWLYTQSQPKAMSLEHFIDKLDRSKKQKDEMKEKLDGWKTPQIKSCFEPIMMAQKECEGTFLNNMLKYGVGLLNTSVKIGQDMFPFAICEYIIRLTTSSKTAVVLDPFVGSGTTAVAAKRLGRRYIGIDSNREYVAIAAKRLMHAIEGEDGKIQRGKHREAQLELQLIGS